MLKKTKMPYVLSVLMSISFVGHANAETEFQAVYDSIKDITWKCNHTKIPFVFAYKSTLKALQTGADSFEFDLTFDGVMPDISPNSSSVLPKHFTGTGKYVVNLSTNNGNGVENWYWPDNNTESGHNLKINDIKISDDIKRGVGFQAFGTGALFSDPIEEAQGFHVFYNVKKGNLTWGYLYDEYSTCKK